ncbi:sulfatase-like hydrolase/transferase [Rasiella sp. SM2506]|uniref:sulfatase-like hydrolase/transferase n=1 Tax=Rasiella sp. SM2506 TaxID=3423914 RepID=UPI003D78E5F2
MKSSVKRSLYSTVMAALAAGLYPLLFYVSNNYTLVNSWSHLVYFISVFLLAPVAIFCLLKVVASLSIFEKIEKFVLPFLNLFVFLFFLKTALYAGFQIWMVLGIGVVALLYTFFFYKYFLKVVVFQVLLAVVASFYLIPNSIDQFQYSKEWMQQPDAIAAIQFKKKPNVYLIQPDGYVNFSELKKGFYNVKERKLEDFLQQENFTLYPNFRSNYASTLSSNSSLFTMKHHYYLNTNKFTEMLDARNIIIGENPVVTIFKNNGYTTNFLAERPYLLANRPKMGYDSSNYVNKDVGYITTGLKEKKDVIEPLRQFLENQGEQPAFHFIEIFEPGHITVDEKNHEGTEKERENWISKLEDTNKKLLEIVSLLKEKDPGGIIIILADHGGFVGFQYMHQAYEKTQDRDKLYSIFGANLAIYWPEEIPEAHEHIQTSVNVFRILFSYLSEDSALLHTLQEEGSYLPILYGARKGIYKVIDDTGKIVFMKR